MFVSYNREKLVNAVIYFVSNTKHCHTLKLFKLLNFLDFEHYRQTGKSVTGLQYKAWAQGPAPETLWHEIKAGGEADLRAAVSIFPQRDPDTNQLLRRDIKRKKTFKSKYFSNRELGIMERLAFFFQELRADDMSEFSHMNDLPWFKVWRGGAGISNDIPYELSRASYSMFKDTPPISSEELEFRAALMKEVQAHTE